MKHLLHTFLLLVVATAGVMAQTNRTERGQTPQLEMSASYGPVSPDQVLVFISARGGTAPYTANWTLSPSGAQGKLALAPVGALLLPEGVLYVVVTDADGHSISKTIPLSARPAR